MNDVFGCQIQKQVWLGLAVAACVLASGCGGTGQENLHYQAETAPGDQQSLSGEVAQNASQLRALIDDAGQSDLNEAIKKYTSILRHPRSESLDSVEFEAQRAEVYFLRGQAFLVKGFPQIALEDFDDAIQFGDDELKVKAYFRRAEAAFGLTRWSQAVADCTHSIRLNPDNGEAFLIRGRALEALRQSTQAEESFQEARRLGIVFQTTFKPPIEAINSVLDRAKLSMDDGNPGVAREILEQAIQDGYDSWEANGLLAQAQFQLQEISRAIVASTRAIEKNPQHADAYRIRGLSHLQHHSFDQAVADLNAAIALDSSLAEQLNPGLFEARRRGGIDPVIRTDVISRIQKSLAAESTVVPIPGETERWLVELIAKRKSSDQIDQFNTLLAATPEAEFDSLTWLADFLMMDDRVPAVNEIRNYLKRNSPDVSTVERRLWESVKSRVAAASFGVNVFPDLAAYAIEYEYLDLLQKSLDSGICNIRFDHLYQSIESENSACLKLILPNSNLLDRESPGLLRYCIEKGRKEQAMLIINRYEGSLTWEAVQFLDMAE